MAFIYYTCLVLLVGIAIKYDHATSVANARRQPCLPSLGSAVDASRKSTGRFLDIKVMLQHTRHGGRLEVGIGRRTMQVSRHAR